MTFGEFVPLVWLKFKGKGADKAPTAGSPQWNNILAITNSKLRDKWAIDPTQNWDTLFREDTFSAADTIELEDDTAKISDTIRVVKDSQTYYPKLVKASQRLLYENTCYISGSPKTLTFTKGIPAQYQGGTVYVPVNTLPEVLTSASSEIVCDNLNWLKCDVAADLAFKKANYADLVAEANDEYEKMCEANQGVGLLEIPIEYPELS